MRTVHETEALRPSDPIPKSMQPHLKGGTRLKLVIKQPQAADSPTQFQGLQRNLEGANSSDADHLTQLPTELGFPAEELEMNPRDLWRLLRRQLHWELEESESLQRELEVTEAILQKEWVEKEILLDQVIKSENSWHERREQVLATVPTAEQLKAQALAQADNTVNMGCLALKSEMSEDLKEDQREAAAVLASLAQG
jgi:hypothetical protein